MQEQFLQFSRNPVNRLTTFSTRASL